MDPRAPSQGPVIPPEEFALTVLEGHRRMYSEALEASRGAAGFDQQRFAREFWQKFRHIIKEMIPYVRVPWSKLRTDRMIHRIDGLS